METEEAEVPALPSSIILHVDLDCFYAAVEQVRLGIPIKQPLAVQQWEGLIAVNYAARAAGVVRHDRVSEALRKCPDLRLVHVETIGSDQGTAASRCSAKVSLERYRQASRYVFEIFHQHADVCERASIDEAYLDITRQVELLVEEQCDWDNELERLVGFQRRTQNVPSLEEKSDMIVESGPLKTFNAIDRRLLAGAIIADRIRMDVRTKLGYTCSVGIATNKLLAKIASARHKPDQQTLIPPRAVFDLMNTIPLRKVKLLGGKVGEELSEKWGCCTAGEAQKVPLKSLLSSFGNRLGHYVYRSVRGIQDDKVQEKQTLKSMLAAKSFEATDDVAVIRKWLGVLAEELSIRMLRDARENHRQPHNLQLYYRSGLPRHTGDHSKSCSMPHTVLHLLSSVCSSTSRVAYEQSTSESTKGFQELESEDVLKNIFQSTERYDPQESELRYKFLGENNKVGSEGTMSEGDIDDTTAGRTAKDLAKLLHQSSFQLFQRIGDAFPCTRLALAASNFQDAPAQGSQSIQHFFVHASQGMKISPPKPPIAVQEIVGTDWPLHKPRGLLRYMSTSVDAKNPQAWECTSSGDRKQSLSVQNDMENLKVENPNNQLEGPDDCKVVQEKNLLKVASTLSSRELSASEFERPELCCEESLCQPEQASANLKVEDYSQTNPCFLSCIDTTAITPGSGQPQNAPEVGIRLAADMEQHVDLTNINVEEQCRILNEIYGAQSADKGRTAFINKGCVLPHERQVAKHRKLTSSKPSQMSLSRYFHS